MNIPHKWGFVNIILLMNFSACESGLLPAWLFPDPKLSDNCGRGSVFGDTDSESDKSGHLLMKDGATRPDWKIS